MRRRLLAIALIASFAAGCSGHQTPKGNGSGTAAAAGTTGDGSVGGAGGRSGTGTGGGGVGGAGGASVDGPGSGGASNVGGSSGRDAGMEDAGRAAEAVATGFSWRTLPSLTKKRQSPMGVAVGGTMYVLGGLDESGLLEDVERLDPEQTGWHDRSVAPQSPVLRGWWGVLGSVIAVAGGYESDGHTPTNALLLFDSTTGAWQSGPPMPTARANPMAAVWNGKLAVIGGGTQYGALQATGVIEIYDPASNSWATSTSTVTPRAGGVAVVDADRIYVIGGAVQNSLYGDPIGQIVTTDGVGSRSVLGARQSAGRRGICSPRGRWSQAAGQPLAIPPRPKLCSARARVAIPATHADESRRRGRGGGRRKPNCHRRHNFGRRLGAAGRGRGARSGLGQGRLSGGTSSGMVRSAHRRLSATPSS